SAFGGGPLTTRPSTSTSPDVGVTRPAMICSNVDFPQPEGPIMETKLQRSISRLTPFKAVVVPPGAAYALRMPSTLRNELDALICMPLTDSSARDRQLQPETSADRISASSAWFSGRLPR